MVAQDRLFSLTSPPAESPTLTGRGSPPVTWEPMASARDSGMYEHILFATCQVNPAMLKNAGDIVTGVLGFADKNAS